YRADPWRDPQTRHRRQQPFDSSLSMACADASTQSELAHLPAQSRSSSVGCGSTHRADADIQDAVRVHRARPSELIHLNVTANPTASWIWRQLMEATPGARNRGICWAIVTPSTGATSGSAPDASA